MARRKPPPTLAQEVGAVLEAAHNGDSRRAVANTLGVDVVNLVRVERGEANPTLARLERLAAAYGVRLKVTAEPLEPRP